MTHVLVKYQTVGTPVPDQKSPALNAGYDNIETGYWITSVEDYESLEMPDTVKDVTVVATLTDEQLNAIANYAASVRADTNRANVRVKTPFQHWIEKNHRRNIDFSAFHNSLFEAYNEGTNYEKNSLEVSFPALFLAEVNSVEDRMSIIFHSLMEVYGYLKSREKPNHLAAAKIASAINSVRGFSNDPELLEVLKEAVFLEELVINAINEDADYYNNNTPGVGQTIEYKEKLPIPEWIVKAKAAIKKATE